MDPHSPLYVVETSILGLGRKFSFSFFRENFSRKLRDKKALQQL
jgi:hypothetical protein